MSIKLSGKTSLLSAESCKCHGIWSCPARVENRASFFQILADSPVQLLLIQEQSPFATLSIILSELFEEKGKSYFLLIWIFKHASRWSKCLRLPLEGSQKKTGLCWKNSHPNLIYSQYRSGNAGASKIAEMISEFWSKPYINIICNNSCMHSSIVRYLYYCSNDSIWQFCPLLSHIKPKF